MKKEKSPALTLLTHIWDRVPSSASYQRLNHAMAGGLSLAIAGGLRFDPDDLQILSQDYRMYRWMGESGEYYYASACGSERASENNSACLAFEKYFGRQPWLWAERNRTPERLHKGSTFTWEGHTVHVTSFNDEKQSLTACLTSDKNRSGFKVGATEYVDKKYRQIEMIKRYPKGALCVRYGPTKPYEYTTTTIVRRFTITHDQLMAARKGYDTRRRELEKAIAAANTLQELDAVSARAGAAGTTREAYRHFDLDILRELFAQRREVIKEKQTEAEYRAYESEQAKGTAKDLERWMQGEDVRRHFTEIRVRIKNNRVEVSNANSVTLPGAKAALAFALKHRRKGWTCNGATFDVDAFTVKSVHPKEGVTIGCTRFDWAEIERFRKLVSGKGKR